MLQINNKPCKGYKNCIMSQECHKNTRARIVIMSPGKNNVHYVEHNQTCTHIETKLSSLTLPVRPKHE